MSTITMNCPDGSSREVYVDDGVAAVMAHQHAEIERLRARVAELEGTVSDLLVIERGGA